VLSIEIYPSLMLRATNSIYLLVRFWNLLLVSTFFWEPCLTRCAGPSPYLTLIYPLDRITRAQQAMLDH